MGGRVQDSAAGILFGAVCVAYIRGAQGFQAPLVSDPLGPSAFPTILGWTGLGLAVAQIVHAWRRRPDPEAPRTSLRQYLPPLALLCLLVGYALVLDLLGYIPATFLFVFAAFLLLKESIRRGLFIAAAFSVGFYLLFTRVLHVGLPAGELFRGW